MICCFGKKNVNNTKKLIIKCRNFDIISVDLYDTTLIRIFDKPEDVFSYIEYKYCLKDFSILRRNAQYKAELKHGYETSIYDIYEELADICNLDNQRKLEILNLEIEVETECVIVNRAIINLIKWCNKHNKQFIFLTDMYLTKDILINILRENNVKGYNDLIVSCEYGKSKSIGNLYHILEHKKRNSDDKIVHIGDNLKTDFINAVIKRKSAILMKRSHENILNKIRCYGISNENHIYDWSYQNMGPTMFAFCSWLDDRMKEDNIQSVLFLTREGAYIKELFESYCQKNHEYRIEVFHASRRSVLSAVMNMDLDAVVTYLNNTDATLEEVCKIFHIGVNEKKYFQTHYGLKDDDRFIQTRFQADFYEYLKEVTIEYSNQQRGMLIRYINQFNIYGKVAVVDIGWSGTMQHYLQRIIDDADIKIKLKGFYVGQYSSSKFSNDAEGFLCSDQNNDTIPDVVNATFLLENALLKIMGTTLSYKIEDGIIVPVEDAPSGKVNPKITDLQNGMNASFKQLCSISQMVYFDLELIKKNFFHNTNYPDIKISRELGDIGWKDIDSIHYIAKPRSLFCYFLSPMQLIHDLQKSGWNSAFLRRLFKLPLPYFKVYKIIKKAKGM